MNLNPHAYLNDFNAVLARAEATNDQGQSLPLEAAFDLAIDAIWAARGSGRHVFVIGNGGSDAIATHLCTDLCNANQVRCQVLNSSSNLTALSNDYGYPTVFERHLALFADPGDVLIAISSSGQSENILRGARMAHAKGAAVITLSGFKPDNPLRSLGDINLYVPSSAYGQVELAHSVLGHFLTDALCHRIQEEAASDVRIAGMAH